MGDDTIDLYAFYAAKHFKLSTAERCGAVRMCGSYSGVGGGELLE